MSDGEAAETKSPSRLIDERIAELGGLSQTLNDARYGRNGQALAVLGKMGVALKTKADGTVDVDAMLPAIADALARQNSSGRRTAAGALGIPVDALPVFTQGGRALGADMRSADTTAPMVSDADVALGKRMQRRHVMAGQTIQRDTVSAGGRATAGLLDEGETLAIGLFSGSVSRDFVPSARINRDAAEKMDHAAERIERASGGRMGTGEVSRRASHARGQFRKYRAMGLSPDDAAAWAANAEGESAGNPNARQPGGPGRGLFQWGADNARFDRRRDFQRLFGKSIEQSNETEQDKFRTWELSHTETRARARIDAASGAAGKSEAITRYYERPQYADRDAADRANIATEIVRQAGPIPVKVEIEMRNMPPGTHARVTAGQSIKPAISRAMAN